MVVWLLRRESLLALLPLNLARPMLESDLLAEVRTAQLGPMEPIGVLQPQSGRGEATDRLSEFLRTRKAGRGTGR
jgi:hypothetical protein